MKLEQQKEKNMRQKSHGNNILWGLDSISVKKSYGGKNLTVVLRPLISVWWNIAFGGRSLYLEDSIAFSWSLFAFWIFLNKKEDKIAIKELT